MEFEELIKKLGYKPESVHKVVGLDRQLIFNYRKGHSKPNAENILKIANGLHTTTDEVICCFYNLSNL